MNHSRRTPNKKARSSTRSRRACRPERLEIRRLLDGASATAAAAYGQLPLSFEINQGQTDPTVNFLAHGAGYGLFLTPSEAVLSLQETLNRSRSAVIRTPSTQRPSPRPA